MHKNNWNLKSSSKRNIIPNNSGAWQDGFFIHLKYLMWNSLPNSKIYFFLYVHHMMHHFATKTLYVGCSYIIGKRFWIKRHALQFHCGNDLHHSVWPLMSKLLKDISPTISLYFKISTLFVEWIKFVAIMHFETII